MLILGIETSCDECSASIVEDGKTIHANIIATQIKDHAPFMGVVPEIASRKHLELIKLIVNQAFTESAKTLDDIDLIAVTHCPGLIGSLFIGVSFAKGLSLAKKIPLLGVNHIEAHLYSGHLENDISFPYIGLLISGGNTLLTYVKSFSDYEILGSTIDDACGEAFDKIAKFYQIGYPGGPAIEKISKSGDANAFSFPHSRLKNKSQYDVSYSGLKTAVINQLDIFKNKNEYSVNDIAASFQKTAIEILLEKVNLAVKNLDCHTVVVSGGVSANQYLRKRLADQKNIKSTFPSLKLCTDNGAMIAAYAYQLSLLGKTSDLTLETYSRFLKVSNKGM